MKSCEKRSYSFSLFVWLGITCSLIWLANPQLVVAASQVPDFYYYYTEKIPLNQSTEMITICFEETISEGQKEALIAGDPVLRDISDETLPYGLVLVVTKEGLDKENITQAIERLSGLPEIKYSTPVFQYRDMKLILMDEFVFLTDHHT